MAAIDEAGFERTCCSVWLEGLDSVVVAGMVAAGSTTGATVGMSATAISSWSVPAVSDTSTSNSPSWPHDFR